MGSKQPEPPKEPEKTTKEIIRDQKRGIDKSIRNLEKEKKNTEREEEKMKKEIKIIRNTDEGEKEFLTHIAVGLDSFTSKSQGRYIDISFHPKMKPFLIQLQTQFLMYDVRNILQVQFHQSNAKLRRVASKCINLTHVVLILPI